MNPEIRCLLSRVLESTLGSLTVEVSRIVSSNYSWRCIIITGHRNLRQLATNFYSNFPQVTRNFFNYFFSKGSFRSLRQIQSQSVQYVFSLTHPNKNEWSRACKLFKLYNKQPIKNQSCPPSRVYETFDWNMHRRSYKTSSAVIHIPLLYPQK